MSSKIKVVVSGLGVVAPNGIGKNAFWSSIVECRSGIKTIKSFDASGFISRIAGEVQDFDPRVHVGHHISTRRIARQTQMALAAAYEALKDASLSEKRSESQPFPLVLGVGSIAIEVVAQIHARLLAHGPARMHPHLAQASHPHHPASVLAQYIPCITQATTTGSACTAGIDAIAATADLIRQGKAEIGICGAADAPINALTCSAMAAGGLLSTRNDTPEKACRPFDIDHAGVLSEGAAIIVVESLDHARQRGVRPYLEITGFSTGVDPDLAQPGSGLENTMGMALANAGLRPEKVDFISAHGPGHPLIDCIETEKIKKIFGTHAYRIPVTSIKGVTGNPLAVAGAFQVVACSLAMQKGIVPPTTNLDKPDPACDLDYVPWKARHIDAKVILINSHGLGGGNSTLIVERPST